MYTETEEQMMMSTAGVTMSSTVPVLKKRSSSSSSSTTQSDTSMEDMSVLSEDEIQSLPHSLPPSSSLKKANPVLRHLVTPPLEAFQDAEPMTENTATLSNPKTFFGGSPVIGIISQPRIDAETEDTEYVIAASYVKWVESAGARVLPIPWDASEEMARAVFLNINGLLFIGGNSVLPVAARVLWDLANKSNAAGDFFPIWGTCLGFEYLLMLASGKDEFVMEGGYEAHNVCWSVDLTEERSELYAKPIVQGIVTEQPVTMNNHEFGISPEAFQSYPGLVDLFRVTSLNVDFKGKPFVSTIESKDPSRYPYYGVQYHPEKNAFEYGTEPGTNTPFENINHSADAVYFSFHLASFFVSLARENLVKGKHVYTDMERFPLVYTFEVLSGLKFQQYYVIPAVGSKGADGLIPFVGKDYRWKLDDYLADHVGIYKTTYSDE